jgi:hypothetical protein
LRAAQEIILLQAIVKVKQSQIDEANNNLAGLQASQAVTQYRQQYYQQLIGAGLSAFEILQVTALSAAQVLQLVSQSLELAGSAGAEVPNETVGISGVSSPVATATWGGSNLQSELGAASRAINMVASVRTYIATMAALVGGWDRR